MLHMKVVKRVSYNVLVIRKMILLFYFVSIYDGPSLNLLW